MAYFVFGSPCISVLELLMFYLACGLFILMMSVRLKNIHNLKVESYVLFSKNFQEFQEFSEAASQVALRELLRGGEGEEGARLNRSFAAKGR